MRTAHYAPDYMPLEGSNGAPSSKDAQAATTGGDCWDSPFPCTHKCLLPYFWALLAHAEASTQAVPLLFLASFRGSMSSIFLVEAAPGSGVMQHIPAGMRKACMKVWGAVQCLQAATARRSPRRKACA